MPRISKQTYRVKNDALAGKLVGQYHRPAIATKKFSKSFANSCLSIDWLTISCKTSTPLLGTLENGEIFLQKYGVIHEKFNSPLFHNNITILDVSGQFHREFLHVSFTPKNKYHKPELVHIKVNNGYLYSAGTLDELKAVMQHLGIQYHHCVRLDIALDVHQLKNRVKPQNFISKFLSNKYPKRWKSSVHYDGISMRQLVHKALRFGSKSNPISWYLYDKTLELKERKDKPYIREAWKENGMFPNVPVWRLEMVINPSMIELFDTDENEIIETIQLDELFDLDVMEMIFRSIGATEFLFCIEDKKQKKKARLKTFNLIDGSNILRYRAKKPVTADNSRTLRISLREIDKHYSQWRDKEESTIGIINKIIEENNLQEWAAHKLQNFRPSAIKLKPLESKFSPADWVNFFHPLYWSLNHHGKNLSQPDLFNNPKQ